MVAAMYLRCLCFRDNDPDVWGRMAVGRLFLETGRMPNTDPFSYTPTVPWVDHEWLSGVYFYLVHLWLGEAGLIVQKAIVGLGILGIVIWIVRLRRAAFLPALLVLWIALPVIAYGFMPRAQVFSYLFFTLWLACLESYRSSHGTRRFMTLALIPLTAPVWANCHGGFLAGFALVAVYVVGTSNNLRMSLSIAAVGALSLSSTLLNPYGLEYWEFLRRAVSMERPNFEEWAPMPLNWQTANFWALAGLAVGGGLWHFRRVRELGLPPILLLAATFFVSLRHMRHMPFFAITACCFVPLMTFKPGWAPWETEETLTARDRRVRILACGVMLTAAIGDVFGLLLLDGPFAFDNNSFPPFPAEVVREARRAGIGGNIAVPFTWGEYVIWHFYGRAKVSVDGRYEECYPPATLAMVHRFFNAAGPGWRELIDHFPTQHVLAPTWCAVNNRLQNDPGWELRFQGPYGCFYSRPIGAPSGVTNGWPRNAVNEASR